MADTNRRRGALVLTRMEGVAPGERRVEVVERKGKGHPDTICDSLAEEVSRALLRHYDARFGRPLHHNVDKALLWAGVAEPAFGGGRVLEPMRIFLAGRVTMEMDGVEIPVADLALESARAWLDANLHALDFTRHVEIRPLFRPGSQDLRALFRAAHEAGTPLANDTACGVGFAPLTDLERVVLEVERTLTARGTGETHPAIGEDVKVLGIRNDDDIELILSCAFIGGYLADVSAYANAKEQAAAMAAAAAGRVVDRRVRVTVNGGDDLAQGRVYLTVTGTSAEAGDDGQAGRGNRSTGLVTPYRPMVIESAAGKNPVSHTGKLYSMVAGRVARDLVENVPAVIEAQCFLLSRIGMPIDEPHLAEVNLRTERGREPEDFRHEVERTLSRRLEGMKGLWRELAMGRVDA